jgi:hypothetical protein
MNRVQGAIATQSLEGQIPAELLSVPQWIAWWSVTGEGRRVQLPSRAWTGVLKAQAKHHKLPIDPCTGGLASSTSPKTWSTAEAACTAAKKWALTGIGFVFSDSDAYGGVDLDNCRDANTGEITDWAWQIVRELNSYTELSPSGTGLHTIVRGKLPAGQGNQIAHGDGKVEMFSRARYFTFTGTHVTGTPTEVFDRQSELLLLHEKLFASRNSKYTSTHSPPSSPILASDDDLIARARKAQNRSKFERLWNGQWEGEYPSQSEADLALCCLLAFWTGKDSSRMDALFRRSGMMQEKWLREKYREETMDKAIAMTGDTWDPRRAARINGSTASSISVPTTAHGPVDPQWPTQLQPEAFHGVAGELVETIDPHTEADPAALLVQFLIAFGNVIGRSPYFTAGADHHYPNQFAVLVGPSSKGRKGSSWSAIQHVVGMADSEWLNRCVQTGLSSGEGLIWAARDEITAKEAIRTGKERRITGYQTVVKDHGVEDKRL